MKQYGFRFVQLVRDKCLIVVSEQGKSHIYIEGKPTLDQAINNRPGKITLNHKSLGGTDCLFAFDQTTRLLITVHGGTVRFFAMTRYGSVTYY